MGPTLAGHSVPVKCLSAVWIESPVGRSVRHLLTGITQHHSQPIVNTFPESNADFTSAHCLSPIAHTDFTSAEVSRPGEWKGIARARAHVAGA